MDLILWRHAEAEEKRAGPERGLTAKGERQAARVAEWLLQRLPAKFTVLSSPARSALATAAALGARVDSLAGLGPDGGVADVLESAHWQPGKRALVVLVGHQPTLGRAAAYLLSGEEREWTIRKGGLWWLSNRARDHDTRVVVRAVLAPDLL
jgi:phosphohistidine phosphatase